MESKKTMRDLSNQVRSLTEVELKVLLNDLKIHGKIDNYEINTTASKEKITHYSRQIKFAYDNVVFHKKELKKLQHVRSKIKKIISDAGIDLFDIEIELGRKIANCRRQITMHNTALKKAVSERMRIKKELYLKNQKKTA